MNKYNVADKTETNKQIDVKYLRVRLKCSKLTAKIKIIVIAKGKTVKYRTMPKILRSVNIAGRPNIFVARYIIRKGIERHINKTEKVIIEYFIEDFKDCFNISSPVASGPGR